MTAPIVDAITFDFWNTLIRDNATGTRGGRLDAWLGILEDVGFAIERQRLETLFEENWQKFTSHWTANQQYLAIHAAEDIMADLGFDLPDDTREALVVAFRDAAVDAPLELTDGIADALRAIKGAGLRIGIICDVGYTPSTVLRSHLERHGVLDLFDHWSFSDEVGAYKPDPAIFRHALDGLGGVAPERTAHIGDLRRTDVAGALGMGLVALRYTGVFDDDDPEQGPEATHVVTHHDQLPKLLGIS